jgi:hypothetical protein
VLKFLALAAYRYASIPLNRYRSDRPVTVVFHQKARSATSWGDLGDSIVFSRRGSPPRSDFYGRWAPRLLAAKNATIVTDVPLEGYVHAFTKRHGIPVRTLENGLVTARPGKPTERLQGPHPAFRAMPGAELKAQLARAIPLFLYMPWIPEHGDKLIAKIDGDEDFGLAPFDLIDGHERAETRRNVLRYARANPDHYRRMVIRRLVPLRASVSGFIVTFDWSPVMRIIVSVCQELGIPTILVPHESVFVDRQKYYWCPKSGASVPISDVTLGWGRLQQEIFLERAYPSERYLPVGAPKFDVYHDYTPDLARGQYHSLFGLDGRKKTILFASQPLDSQLDSKTARQAQRAAIADLMSLCETFDAQLIVRLPPSRDDILGTDMRSQILASDYAAFDDATCYLVGAEEALYHADIVSSVNSTMLFEGALLGRPALSMKYVEFDPFWEKAGIPAARSLDEAKPIVEAMLSGRWVHPADGMAWAADMFGIGTFDGKAADRIRAFLLQVVAGKVGILEQSRPGTVATLLAGQPIDVAGVPLRESTLKIDPLPLLQLLRARSLQTSLRHLEDVSSANLFIDVLDASPANRQRLRETARLLAKPLVFVGQAPLPIRAPADSFDGAPINVSHALAIVIDDIAHIQDATRASRLEKRLQEGPDLTEAERRRAEAIIAGMATLPHSPASSAAQKNINEKRTILLVDERRNSPSVALGMAGAETFEAMLNDVVSTHEDCDIVIATVGGQGGPAGFLATLQTENERHAKIRTVSVGADIMAALEDADEVHVVTSDLGFHALFAGKVVHVHGMPFYAGWGITRDRQSMARRSRNRTLVEIVHFACIEASRYLDPATGRPVEIEEALEQQAQVATVQPTNPPHMPGDEAA